MIALDDVADELQALAEHVRAKHASPALAWGVMIDGRLAMGGGAGALDDGRAPTATARPGSTSTSPGCGGGGPARRSTA